MNGVLEKYASLLLTFIFGCIVGAALLYFNIRLNTIEQQQVMFQKNVEQFAKQVNDEITKIRSTKTSGK